MAVLSTARRNALPAKTFAGPHRSFPIPADWGVPGWTPERFKAFNDARRKLHKLMQGWDQILSSQSAIVRKADFD